MIQSFDAKRWWLLVGKHWSENKRKYTLSLFAIAGLLLLWFVVILISDGHRGINASMQLTTYYFGLFLGGCLYGSILFADLGSKTKGLNYLVVPASHLEKLLCALFYGVIVFFVCYTGIFYIVDMLAVKVSNAIAYSYWMKHHLPGETFEPQRILNVFRFSNWHNAEPGFSYYLLITYFVIQSLFILGSVYFARFSFIKTVIVSLIIGLVMVFVAAKVIAGILPPGDFYHGINSYRFYTVKSNPSGEGLMIYGDSNTDKVVSLPEWINTVLLFLLKYALAPLFWLATYYRLKEKEI